MTSTRSLATALLLASALVLSACGGSGGATKAASGPTMGSAAPQSAAPTSWTSQVTPAADGIHPVVVGTTVVVLESTDSGIDGTSTGGMKATALNATTGKSLWSSDLPLPQGGSFTQDGVHLPTLTTGSSGGTTVVLADYLTDVPTSGLSQGGRQRYVAALDPASGHVVWSKPAPGLLERGDNAPQPLAIFVSDSGVTALNVATGEQARQTAIPTASEYETGGVVVVVQRNAVWQWLTALDAGTGQQLWATDKSGVWTVLDARGGAVLATINTAVSHTVQAQLLDAKTGTARATAAAGAGAGATGELTSDGTAGYVIDPNQFLTALNPAGGWQIALPQLPQPLGGAVNFQKFVSVDAKQLKIDSNGVVTVDAVTGKQIGAVQPRGSQTAMPLWTADVDGWHVSYGGGSRSLTGTRAKG